MKIIFIHKNIDILGVAILSNAPEKLPEKKKVERNTEKEKDKSPSLQNAAIRHRGGQNNYINRLVGIFLVISFLNLLIEH